MFANKSRTWYLSEDFDEEYWFGTERIIRFDRNQKAYFHEKELFSLIWIQTEYLIDVEDLGEESNNK